MDQSQGILLPLRTEAQKLRGRVELEIGDRCGQVHDSFERSDVVSSSGEVRSCKDIDRAHFIARRQELAIPGGR